MTSDPGSDLTSHLLNEVNNILGIKHRLGLVDRPQGTGIERDVAEVKRFLRSLTAHSDMQHDWSTPRILGVAEFLINNDPHMPSNVSPYEMEFGRHDKHLSHLITTLAESLRPKEFLFLFGFQQYYHPQIKPFQFVRFLEVA